MHLSHQHSPSQARVRAQAVESVLVIVRVAASAWVGPAHGVSGSGKVFSFQPTASLVSAISREDVSLGWGLLGGWGPR